MHTSALDRSPRATARLTRRITRRLAAALLAAAGLGAAGCTESVDPIQLASLRILPQVDSFFTGQTTAGNPFAITLFDINGTEIKDGRTITYSSSAPAVFTVDAKTGVISGKSVGFGLFRATSDGRSVEASVKIILPVDKVQLNTGDFNLVLNAQRQLVPTLVASDGSTISGRLITYSSSNTTVATVSTTGLVSAISEGTSTITVSVEGKSATLVVTVTREPVALVTLTPPVAPILRVGAQFQITATPRNATGGVLSGRTVTWFSNNLAVASVSSTGLVTAIAPGSATITAEVEGRTASMGLTVTLIPIGSVTLAPAADTLVEGDVRQYNPVVKDSTGKVLTSLTGRSVLFQSNNLPVATVGGNTGVVGASSQGTAAITVTVDGVMSNEITLRVARVAKLTLTPNPVTLAVGATQLLTVKLEDALGNTLTTTRPISFVTNNPNIATVTQSGVVTGVSVGTVNIVAVFNSIAGTTAVTIQ